MNGATRTFKITLLASITFPLAGTALYSFNRAGITKMVPENLMFRNHWSKFNNVATQVIKALSPDDKLCNGKWIPGAVPLIH